MILNWLGSPRRIVLVLLIIVVGGFVGFVTRRTLEDPVTQIRWGYVTTLLPGAILWRSSR